MLAAAGMTMAQNVYTAGYYDNTETGKREAAVCLDGELLYHSELCNNNVCTDVVVDETTGDVYWARNCYTSSSSDGYGDILLNDGNYFLQNVSGTSINALALGNDNVYAAGKMYVSGKSKAALWKNGSNTPYASWGDGTNDYTARSVFCANNGTVYTCGYKEDSDVNYTSYVWKNNSSSPEFQIANACFSDVVVYNGDIYTTGYEVTGVGEMTAKIWKNGQELYSLDAGWVSGGKLKIFGGDIYATTTTIFADRTYIWKNGQLLYEIPYTGTETGFILSDGIDATMEGVFYTVSSWISLTSADHCDVYQNADLLYTTTETNATLNDIYVETAPCEYSAYLLPFSENFEMGESNWNCWTVIDADHNNGNYDSYWTIGGRCPELNTTTPKSGDHYAQHIHNAMGTASQVGWLVTPMIASQPGRNITMTFQSKTSHTFVDDYASVWVSTDDNPKNTDAYVKVWALTGENTSWEQQTVDLSEFTNQPFYVAFKYESAGGAYAPAWNIDDVNITESWTPCSPVAAFPFEERFSADPFVANTCWYLLDNDQDGLQSFWQWDQEKGCAYHPYGPNDDISQEGWMITPTLNLTSGRNYTLTFKSTYDYPGDIDESSVWIAVDKTGVPNPADYTKIWEENNATTSWSNESVDLSAYAGHKVNIAFKYGGVYAHQWYVDDIVVASSVPQYTVTAEANVASYGMVFGGGSYEQGSICTLSAMPFNGYVFTHWNDGNTDNPRDVEVNGNITLIAYFSGNDVNENGETVLNIYPNPAKDCIRIEGLEANSEVEFYDILGMMVKRVNATADQEINVSDLANGVYMVRCGNRILRFVKE